MSLQLDTISYVTTVVAIISASSVLITFFKEWIKQRTQSASLKEDSFTTLLQSSNIKSLGNYLDKNIGKLYISDYVDNQELTRKVDLFLNRLTQFVGTEDEIETQTENQKAEEPKSKKIDSFTNFEALQEEFKKILHELYQGETWNSLARLRRYLEIKIKELAKNKGVENQEQLPLTILLDQLKHMGIVEINNARDLKWSIRVCNRAIHGQSVELKEAEQAIYIAAKIINSIGGNMPNKT